MRVDQATGSVLDSMVGKALKLPPPFWNEHGQCASFSTSWSQGGPIIEREGIDILKDGAGWTALKTMTIDHPHLRVHGPTPLIAAMRCYVMSKLGADVQEGV